MDYVYPLVGKDYTNEHGLVFMITSIIYEAAEAQETQVAQEHLIRERDRGELHHHPYINVSGEVLQKFLDTWISMGSVG